MELVNRVAKSGLVTINLEDYYPESEMIHFDLKDYLFKELILREKDFRLALKEHNWEQYEGKTVLVYCSNDAIIPVWAYMLVVTKIGGRAQDVYCGNQNDYLVSYYRKVLQSFDVEQFANKKIVIKGCSDLPVPAAAYLELTRKLLPSVNSIMYGEPCSTVPIFKKK